MKYKIKENRDDTLSLLLRILKNRGIEDVEHYLSVSEEDNLNPLLLDNMAEGEKIFKEAAEGNKKTFLLVDCDADGYTSAALMYNYTHRIYPEWVDNYWKYYLHDGKQHGLNDCFQYILDNDFEFVLVPDAGSNDHGELRALAATGIKILILDHHEADRVDENAVVINNQLCDYPNKDLSGVGIAYKFCNYYDSVNGFDIADDFLDLVATGCCADMMNLRSYETHYLFQKGLTDIKNPFLLAIMEKNDYSLQGHINPHGISFYVSPVINAVTRVGTLEEKELLFKSMLETEAYKKIPSGKRGHSGELTPLVEEAIRIGSNVRSRQNKVRDSKFASVCEQIDEQGLDDNKILAVTSEEVSEDEKGITGLIANQVMAKYKKPVLILRKTQHEDGPYYDGSARCPGNCGIDDLRSLLESSALTLFAQGHASAFGISIKEQNLGKLITWVNEKLKDIDFTSVYEVDAIYNIKELDPKDIIVVDGAKDLWGQGIEEPLIAVEGIKVSSNNVFINEKVLKITAPNGVSFVKFRPTPDEMSFFSSLGQSYNMDVVGTCSYSTYDNTAQVMIADYNISKLDYWDF